MGNVYEGREAIWSQNYNLHSQGPLQALEKVEDREGNGGVDMPPMCVDTCLVTETWVMRWHTTPIKNMKWKN